MKKYLSIFFLLIAQAVVGQTTFMKLYQRNGQIIKLPVNVVDSSTFAVEPNVSLPNLFTWQAENIGFESASSGGVIFDNGGAPIQEYGVCWSKNPNPTYNDSKQSYPITSETLGLTIDTFFLSLDGLESNTTYYVRAFAVNSAGIDYGNTLLFKTLDFNDASLNSTLFTIYSSLFEYAPQAGGGSMHDAFGQKAIDLANDLMGNDMLVHAQGFGWFNADYNYSGWLREAGVNTRSSITWRYYYKIIQDINRLLSYTNKATGATNQKQIQGECYAIRAYAYFGLINNFQQTYKGNENAKGVPVYTLFGEDYKGRGTVQQVYNQIISDLINAEGLLNGQSRSFKTRIDVSVVRGLRARVALAMEDYATAAIYANQARQGYSLMTNASYTSRSGFSNIQNTEWMWGALIPSDQSTVFASFFSHMDASQYAYAQLGSQKKITKWLYDRIPAGDIRKTVFRAPGTGTNILPDYTQTKFSVPTVGSWAADYLFMRAAEMYLIEAEALARQGQDVNARNVLEQLVKPRFPSYSAASFSGINLINEILLQRRIELWGEGFSLFDIKRTRSGLNRPTGEGNHGLPNLNPVVLTLPDASPQFLMRIPLEEIQNNLKMNPTDQNP